MTALQDKIVVALTLALSKHPDWPGATDEFLRYVADEVLDALDLPAGAGPRYEDDEGAW